MSAADYIIAGLLAAIGILLCLLIWIAKHSAGQSVTLTDHAIMRMEERMDIRNEDRMLHLAQQAYQYGNRAEDLPQKAAILIRKKQKEYGNSTMVIYKGFIYVFSNDRVLITVYRNDYT